MCKENPYDRFRPLALLVAYAAMAVEWRRRVVQAHLSMLESETGEPNPLLDRLEGVAVEDLFLMQLAAERRGIRLPTARLAPEEYALVGAIQEVVMPLWRAAEEE